MVVWLVFVSEHIQYCLMPPSFRWIKKRRPCHFRKKQFFTSSPEAIFPSDFLLTTISLWNWIVSGFVSWKKPLPVANFSLCFSTKLLIEILSSTSNVLKRELRTTSVAAAAFDFPFLGGIFSRKVEKRMQSLLSQQKAEWTLHLSVRTLETLVG